MVSGAVALCGAWGACVNVCVGECECVCMFAFLRVWEKERECLHVCIMEHTCGSVLTTVSDCPHQQNYNIHNFFKHLKLPVFRFSWHVNSCSRQICIWKNVKAEAAWHCYCTKPLGWSLGVRVWLMDRLSKAEVVTVTSPTGWDALSSAFWPTPSWFLIAALLTFWNWKCPERAELL